MNEIIKRYEDELCKLEPELDDRVKELIDSVNTKEKNRCVKGKALVGLLNKQ